MPAAVALVPARAGSQRVPGKNVRVLAGHPLIAYAIAGARESGCFDAVVVSTDSEAIAEVSRAYGAQVPGLRPEAMATATSSDIEWVRHSLAGLAADGRSFDVFSILRPTSPFRTGATIRRAWDQLMSRPDADSIRAVERCRQHPGKMWVLEGEGMRPLLAQPEGVPYHSRQYQALPEVYVQNSSLEIARMRAVTEMDSIAGERVLPFLSDPREGFTIDYESDWAEAERIAAEEPGALPAVTAPAAVGAAR